MTLEEEPIVAEDVEQRSAAGGKNISTHIIYTSSMSAPDLLSQSSPQAKYVHVSIIIGFNYS